MNYPVYRPRRLRKNEKFRNMIQETELSPNHLIYPVFVKEMAEKKVPIPAMPDVYQFSVEGLPQEIAFPFLQCFFLVSRRRKMKWEAVPMLKMGLFKRRFVL